jgi:threonine synthase
MRTYFGETGQLICPHTAVATATARDLPATAAVTVILSTAHAAKFPETVLEATGLDAPLPRRCETLLEKGELFDQLPADLQAVKAYIREQAAG